MKVPSKREPARSPEAAQVGAGGPTSAGPSGEAAAFVRLSANGYREICLSILAAVGAEGAPARTVVENMLRSDRRGIASHGIHNLRVYVGAVAEGTVDPAAEPSIVYESKTTALIDGNGGFGQVACGRAVRIALDKASEAAMAMVGVRNCGHVGHLGDYTLQLAERGLIGIAFANCNALVAPHGGTEPRLGTNPISVAAPAGEEAPFVLDMATSVGAAGYINHKISRGEPVPEGWTVDASGRPTTDPARLFASLERPLRWKENFTGALLPAAGVKGYGLALVADLLAGALTGGFGSVDMVEGRNQVYLQAMQPSAFGHAEAYAATAARILDACRAATPRPGFDAVMVPGDPERAAAERSRREGVPVARAVLESIAELGRRHGVDVTPLFGPSTEGTST